MKVLGLSWVGIATDDYPETLRFFTETLGLQLSESVEGQAILKAGDGQFVEIFGRDGRGKSLNDPPTIAFEVEDLGAARDELLEGGAEPIGEIGSWGGFEWLYFRAPGGQRFAVKKTPHPRWRGD